MSEVITREIDLRPRWVQTFGKRSSSPRSRSLLFIASGAGALVLAMLAFGKGPASPEKRAVPSVAAAAIVEPQGGPPSVANGSRELPLARRARVEVDARATALSPRDPPAEQQIEQPVHPVKDDAPIVIQATREADVVVSTPSSEKIAPMSGTGKVKLDSDPRVSVFAGQRRLGRTPLEVSLSAGTHELRFVDKAKHLEVKRKIDVKAGGTHSRDLSFGIGALRVRAPDGTKLWLNKKYAGAAPFKKIELSEGRHRLKLKKGDEVVEEWIAVPPSQTVDYRVNFAD